MQLFESQSKNLFDFFNEPGAYYIPFYQRQYSWDTDNVTKLMDDIYDGVRTICHRENYLRFIGAVILFEERNPEVGKHYDYTGLISNIFNVIDGQQRISTIAVIACLLSHKLKQIKSIFEEKGWTAVPTIPRLVSSLENVTYELEDFYSIEVRKSEVEPSRKPIIIRALNQRENPVTDQWTLKSNPIDFYKSDVTALISHYISNGEINGEIANEKLKANVQEIHAWIERTMDSDDFPSAYRLLSDGYKGLKDFADRNIELATIKAENHECYQLACGSIKLLAFIRFITHRTYLTYIKCPSEDLAFDMFQSLNATGTPLTAIEVFKPLVVNTMEPEYGRSKAKNYFDEIDRYFDGLNADNKAKFTDEILQHVGMIHDGVRDLGRRFSAQRDWLFNSFDACKLNGEQEQFVEWIANLCLYWENIYKKRKPRRDAKDFELVKHLGQLGMMPQDADLAALCIFFLKDSGHSMAHYVVAIFYGKLFRAKTVVEKQDASDELLKVVKACAAFYIYWQGTVSGFPDVVYRDLFAQNATNMSNKSGKHNQCSVFVINHFLTALDRKAVFDRNDRRKALGMWLAKAPVQLGYGRYAVCRFSLFTVSHQTAPDLSDGNAGNIVKAKNKVPSYLTCERWYSADLEVIEHIANQKMPMLPYKYNSPDSGLYPGDTSIVDRIGNLTLWSRSANSSTYSEWPDKCLYYASLTSTTPAKQADIDKLKQKLGVKNVPPGLQKIASSSSYLPHLAPLVLKGFAGQSWDKAAIDKRGKNLCQHLFDTLMEWLSVE